MPVDSADGSASSIEFWTLGTFALRAADGRECARLLARPKYLAVLAYLAVSARSHVHSRDTLVGLLWPELDAEHARLALRQAIHVLGRELGTDVLAVRGGAMIGLAPGRVWCDATAFDEAVSAGDHMRALELYRGDFLPGMLIPAAPQFERWLRAERMRLRAKATATAWFLADEMEALGSRDHAVYWAQRAVELAPDDEQGVRRLLSLLDRFGDTIRALRAYDDYCRWLAAELEVEPSPDTRALAETIRSRVRSTPPKGTAVRPATATQGVEYTA